MGGTSPAWTVLIGVGRLGPPCTARLADRATEIKVPRAARLLREHRVEYSCNGCGRDDSCDSATGNKQATPAAPAANPLTAQRSGRRRGGSSSGLLASLAAQQTPRASPAQGRPPTLTARHRPHLRPATRQPGGTMSTTVRARLTARPAPRPMRRGCGRARTRSGTACYARLLARTCQQDITQILGDLLAHQPRDESH
jgi:hypothetical protein